MPYHSEALPRDLPLQVPTSEHPEGAYADEGLELLEPTHVPVDAVVVVVTSQLPI